MGCSNCEQNREREQERVQQQRCNSCDHSRKHQQQHQQQHRKSMVPQLVMNQTKGQRPPRIVGSNSADLIELVKNGDSHSTFNPGYKSTSPPDGDKIVQYPGASLPIFQKNTGTMCTMTRQRGGGEVRGGGGCPREESCPSPVCRNMVARSASGVGTGTIFFPSPSPSPTPQHFQRGATFFSSTHSLPEVKRTPPCSPRNSWVCPSVCHSPSPSPSPSSSSSSKTASVPSSPYYWELEIPAGHHSHSNSPPAAIRHRDPGLKTTPLKSPPKPSKVLIKIDPDNPCRAQVENQQNDEIAASLAAAAAAKSKPKSAKVHPEKEKDPKKKKGDNVSGLRSQSCEALSGSSKLGNGKDSTKRSKRRCPTPPRVLSPCLDNMKCEVIADI